MYILSSLLRKRGSEKRSLVNEYAATYDWEIRPWLNTSTSLEFRRIFSNMFVPMNRVITATDGSPLDTVRVNSVGANDLRLVARFSKDETVARVTFE